MKAGKAGKPETNYQQAQGKRNLPRKEASHTSILIIKTLEAIRESVRILWSLIPVI